MTRPAWPYVTALTFFLMLSCVTNPEQHETGAAGLDQTEILAHIPSHASSRSSWADEIYASIQAVNKTPTVERVCAVIAIIQQESGFQADPTVPNLPRIVREGLLKKLSRLGPLAEPALAALLAGKAPGHKESFGHRIDQMRTERDLDTFFRDMAAAYQDAMPGTYAVASGLSWLLGKGTLQGLNPVTTAGCMQVKVPFARTLNPDLTDTEVRDQLYTRSGCVRAGTARLLGYSASYDDIIYRFADYNAGAYSSRNAAFQMMLTDLTGEALAFDGDLLAYDESGDAKELETKTMHAMLTFGKAHDVGSWKIHHNAAEEKAEDFEDTTMWDSVRSAWQVKTGKTPPYAIVPRIELTSPKLSKGRSTAWYASAVKRHYTACRGAQNTALNW